MAERKTFKKGKNKKTMKKRTIRYTKIKTNSKRKIRSRKKNRKKKVKGWNYKLLKHNANLKQYQIGGQGDSMEVTDKSLEVPDTSLEVPEQTADRRAHSSPEESGNRLEEYRSLVQTFEEAYTAYHSLAGYMDSHTKLNAKTAANSAIEDAAQNWPTVTGELYKNINGFVVKSLIGAGTFGKVFLVEQPNGKYVLKAIERLTYHPQRLIDRRDTATNEVEIMIRLINAPFVAKIYHHFMSPENYCIVSQFYPGGDLGNNFKLRDQQLMECLADDTGDTDAKNTILSSMVGTLVKCGYDTDKRFIYEGKEGTKHKIHVDHYTEHGVQQSTRILQSDKFEWAQRYSETTTANLLAHIVLALEYMHKRGICHLDLKPENIVISASGHAYLTDFGSSRAQTDGLLPSGQRLTQFVKNISGENGKPLMPYAIHVFMKDNNLNVNSRIIINKLDRYKGRYPPEFNQGTDLLSCIRIDGRKVDCWMLAEVIKVMCGYDRIIKVESISPRQNPSTLDDLIARMKNSPEGLSTIKDADATQLAKIQKGFEKRFTIKDIKEHAFFKGSKRQSDPQLSCGSGSRGAMCVRGFQSDLPTFDSGVDNENPLALFKSNDPLPIKGGFKK